MCERTKAEYQDKLSPTKEEKERQHQLLDAVFKQHQVVSHRTDAQQPPHFKEDEEESQPPHFEEEEELWIAQKCLLGQEEADLTKFPLPVVSVKTENHEEKPPESSQLHHSPNIQQLVGRREECPPRSMEWSPPLKHIKEEEEELWIAQDLRQEADLTKFPLTVVSVKTEDHEEKPPESSQLPHGRSEEVRVVESSGSSSPQHMTAEADGDHCGRSQAGELLAPLSDADDTTSHNNVNMESHMRTQTEEKPSCSLCGNTFSRKSTLKHHMNMHTGERPFNCSVCAKGFIRNWDLTRHMRGHTGEKSFCCSVCGKTFSDSSAIKMHMRTHTGEKPFVCSVCTEVFFQSSHLTQHMQTHTGERPFSCSVCGKRFSHQRSMQAHIRLHSREKPFSCLVCAKGFVRNIDLTRHMRTHTGEKHFSCSVCSKRFSNQNILQIHMRTHTGEKPYSCSMCGKRSSNKGNIQRHMRTHTGQ
ncbi:zinc finger protein 135-like isoform X1 [Nerophis ophidion]|uniref:zinc finger protein 135-like isoform X1 n=1 Tax=Nerophis ophidion TaxID=159077 RepID=UPI002ADFDFCC|nr:zinc finger protein 135-like isoform X1 [Nerophis ophidion]